MKSEQKHKLFRSPNWRRHWFPVVCALLWAGALAQLSIGFSNQPAFGMPVPVPVVVDVEQSPADPVSHSSDAHVSPPARDFWLIPRSWYDPMIRRVASAHGVDPALVKAVVQAESAFDPLAVSKDGARGLMQVLPTTAARFQVRDLHNPYLNLQAGVGYLRKLLDQFDGDVRLAVAAYNAGENAVLRFQGVPPYPETRRYLDKVLGLYWHYRRAA